MPSPPRSLLSPETLRRPPQNKMATADDCPICLAPLRGACKSLECGHIYHESCLASAVTMGHEQCAVCRKTIGEVRMASTRACVGDQGYRAFVAPKPLTSEELTEYMLQRPLPAPDSRLSVLATVTRSLPAFEVTIDPDAEPNNYMFVLDISYSMGRLGDCSSTRCSRLGLALCYLAAFVSKTLRPRDRYRILAFDSTHTDLLGGWQTKGEDFCRLDAMDAWSTAIRSVRSGGSQIYAAIATAVGMQEQAAKAATYPAAHVLIALTDGEAMDEANFESASAAVRRPDCPGGGFRALLVKIDDADCPALSGRQMRDLGTPKRGKYSLRSFCRAPPAVRPEHIVYHEAPLPAITDLSTPAGNVSSLAFGSAFRSLALATPTPSRFMNY